MSLRAGLLVHARRGIAGKIYQIPIGSSCTSDTDAYGHSLAFTPGVRFCRLETTCGTGTRRCHRAHVSSGLTDADAAAAADVEEVKDNLGVLASAALFPTVQGANSGLLTLHVQLEQQLRKSLSPGCLGQLVSQTKNACTMFPPVRGLHATSRGCA